jgi:signal peptidase I
VGRRVILVLVAVTVSGCGSSANPTAPKPTANAAAPLLVHLHRWRMPSPSMEPTLKVGSFVLTDNTQTPKLGQIVVFHPPTGADPVDPVCANPQQGAGHPAMCSAGTAQASTQTFLKRIVGLPGDRLTLINGHVYRNGTPESEPYTAPCDGDSCGFPSAITVPAGQYYMLGDNRGFSDDSRFWGPVPQANILGVVISCQPATAHCAG